MRHSPGQRVQLHRAFSKLGWASRTVAWDWICRGIVRVDGRVERNPLAWIDVQRQRVQINENEAQPLPRITIAVHKPKKIVTTRSDERNRATVYDLLPAELPWLFPVGRLDADSEGLLILTNDSQLATRITDPDQHVPKLYRVTVRGRPSDAALAQIREGITLDDGPCRPAPVTEVDRNSTTTEIEMVLTEGRNRQARRMWAKVGHPVVRLFRIGIGRFRLGDLPTGKFRILQQSELQQLIASDSP